MDMESNKENYTSYAAIGLLLTLLMIAGLGVYSMGESGRLTEASAAFTGERVQRGRGIYNEQCVACHGGQGEGGIGPALNNRTVLKNTLDTVFFSVIRSGVPNTQMPAWSVDFGGPLTDEDVRDVVAFVRAWEPNAPEVLPVVFTPDPARGALLFSSTCAICHGENGAGTEKAPTINDTQRLASFDDDWYRGVIRNGRPAKGMPTWGTVLSPNQIEDLIAMVDAWRGGTQVKPEFSVTSLLENAVFSLENRDAASASLQVNRALGVAQGVGLEVLRNAAAQLANGDDAGALVTLQALKDQWPLGDATVGASVYSTYCTPCHGAEGLGGIGVALKPNEFVQTNTNQQLVDFVLAGRPGTAMAGFKSRLTDSEIADVIAFLRLWQP
jgi:mono/diheme cytochrome c family protein